MGFSRISVPVFIFLVEYIVNFGFASIHSFLWQKGHSPNTFVMLNQLQHYVFPGNLGGGAYLIILFLVFSP